MMNSHVRALGVFLLALLGLSCSSVNPVYITVDLSGVPANATAILPVAVVDATFKPGKPVSLPLLQMADPGRHLTFSLSLPAGSTGTLSLGVAAVDASQCLLAVGSVTGTLADMGSAVQVPLSGLASAACPAPQAQLLLQQGQIVPYLTAVTPSTITIGKTTQITVFGFGFLPGIVATLSGITVSVVWKSPTEITLTLPSQPLSGAPLLTVQNPEQPPVSGPPGLVPTPMPEVPRMLSVDSSLQRLIGSTKDDKGGAVAVDKNGDVFLAGYFSDTLSLDGKSLMAGPGLYTPLIAKFAHDTGARIWTLSTTQSYLAAEEQGIPSPLYPGPYVSLAVDSDSNLIAVGSFSSIFRLNCQTDVVPTTDAYAMFIVKISGETGVCMWSQVLSSGKALVMARSVSVNSRKQIFVSGYFTGTLAFNANTYPANNRDAFVASYSPEGTLANLRVFSSAGEDSATTIAVDKDDNVLVAGHFGANFVLGGKALQNRGKLDLFLTKMTSALEDQTPGWAVSFGGSGNDVLGSMAVSKSSGLITLSGSTDNVIVWNKDTISPANASDGFVAVLESNGSARWGRAVGASQSAAGRTVAFDTNDNVLVAGVWAGSANLGTPKPTAMLQDLFVARYAAADPTDRQVLLFQGSEDEDVFGMALHPKGTELLLTGYSKSPSISIGSGTLSGAGGADILLFRLAYK